MISRSAKVLVAVISVICWFPVLIAQPKTGLTYWINASDKPTENPARRCGYPKVDFKPSVRYSLPHEVRETSGLANIGGKLFTHNDSHHLPVLYALSPDDGRVLQRISLSNASNIDWEELARDDQYLYVGDFGNNSGQRRIFQIYRISLSSIPEEGDAEVVADTIRFTYPNQPTDLKYLAHNYDCEAMVATADALYLFSKNWADGNTWLYKLPKIPGNYEAIPSGSFDSRGLITGADFCAETRTLALVGYTKNTWKPFAWIMHGFEGEDFFSGISLRINFKGLITNQIEGVVFSSPTQLTITSEKTKTMGARAFALKMSDILPDITLFDNRPERDCSSVLHIHRTNAGVALKFFSKQKQLFMLHIENQNHERTLSGMVMPCRSSRTLIVPTEDTKVQPAFLRIQTKDFQTLCPIP